MSCGPGTDHNAFVHWCNGLEFICALPRDTIDVCARHPLRPWKHTPKDSCCNETVYVRACAKLMNRNHGTWTLCDELSFVLQHTPCTFRGNSNNNARKSTHNITSQCSLAHTYMQRVCLLSFETPSRQSFERRVAHFTQPTFSKETQERLEASPTRPPRWESSPSAAND